MSQVTGPITLADGQTTPVNVAFYPEEIAPKLSTFVDRTSGVSTLYRRLSIRNEKSHGTRDNRFQRNISAFSCPVSGTLPSGATGVIRTLRATVIFDLPDGCLDSERKDLFAFVKNAMSNAYVIGAMRDYDPLY